MTVPILGGAAANIPAVLFVDRVSPPLTIDWPAICVPGGGGVFSVPLDSGGGAVLDVTHYRKVSVRIGTTQAAFVQLMMGKISGTTLASSYSVPVDQNIHTYDIVGPELSLSLSGSSRYHAEKVQLWLYLTS